MGEAVSDLSTVSVEREGRVLSGVGVAEDTLHEAMDRLTPESEPETGKRDERGQFAPTEAQTPPAKPEPKGRQRYSQLTSERDEAAKRAAEAEARATELAERLKALESTPRPEARKTDPAVEPETPNKALRKRPSINEIGTTYADWDAYEADLGAWDDERVASLRSEVEAQVRASIDAERAASAHAERVHEVFTAGRKAYQDFDAVVNGCTLEFPVPLLLAIKAMPEAHHVQYALGKDRAAAERIIGLRDPVLMGVELAKLVPSSVASPASTAAARVSQAPAPYQPVSGGTTTTSPPLHELAASGNYEAYKARRESERKK